jgi:hypothetical protein
MKSAREGRLHKLHRRDWPGFLNHVVPAFVWQAFCRQVHRSTDPRIRWIPKYVVLCWAMMGWSIQEQLTERFREGREALEGFFRRRRGPGKCYQGLMKATGRLGGNVLHTFWCCLREQVGERISQDVWYWYNWVVIAADGSRIDAPRTRANEKALHLSGKHRTTPQWWVTLTIHLPTRLIWDWRCGPGDSSERSHLKEMIATLPKDALVVADTGFGGFEFLWGLARAKVSFLVRCGGNTTLLVDDTRQRLERKSGQTIVHLWPTGKRKKAPLTLRLIVLKRGDKRVYLLTNVRESTRLSRAMASKFYRARWGVEVAYRSFKQTLGRRKVLAQTPSVGAMELAGNLVALGLLMLQGALAMGARVVLLSVAEVLKIIRRAVEAARYGWFPKSFVAELREGLMDSYARHGPKHARDWPHKKTESPPGPPRMRRPTSREKARIQAFYRTPEAVLG